VSFVFYIFYEISTLIFTSLWKSYGVEISIKTSDITSKAGCEELIQDAMKLGSVSGIFNLAVVLRDGIFENQDSKMFADSLGPKAEATRFLDEISRKLCPNLKHFVVFSSVSCGRGNAGQSNYGMANSIMERIMEQRAKVGLPAKAIQWGAIGDVGLLASLQEQNLDMTIGGTLPQGIVSCLEVLDTLMLADETIVASMIVAEKNIDNISKGNIIDTIFNIMSIRDKKAISMETSLSRLGMDSLTGVEIQQVLERDYGTVLLLDEMRTITLSQLEKLVHSKGSDEVAIEKPSDGIEFLLTGFGDEKTSNQTILQLQSGSESKDTKVLIVPGMEGMAGEVWHEIAKEMKHPTYILQFGNATDECTTLEEMFDAISKVKNSIFNSKQYKNSLFCFRMFLIFFRERKSSIS
jgi:fatty acid synthase, animal type